MKLIVKYFPLADILGFGVHL